MTSAITVPSETRFNEITEQIKAIAVSVSNFGDCKLFAM